MRRKTDIAISRAEATSAIAWEHLGIADLEDHLGENPADLYHRQDISAALNAAYSAGMVAHRAETGYSTQELVAVLDAVLEVAP